jgi:hypothetical protein
VPAFEPGVVDRLPIGIPVDSAISFRCIGGDLLDVLLDPCSFAGVVLGDTPKRLGLPKECANYRDEHDESLVVPDVIVHRPGPDGPNVLVLEVKKTSHPVPRDCDRARIRAFGDQYHYEFAALIECETLAPGTCGARDGVAARISEASYAAASVCCVLISWTRSAAHCACAVVAGSCRL